MKTKVKICGLNSIEHIETSVKAGAFWYGLIFFDKSPRNISLKNASYLIKETPKNIYYPISTRISGPISNELRYKFENNIKIISIAFKHL